ncbi:hypothetical protein KL918_004534 [Ogataea parapolymorpha]|uniref:Protein PNS1 n=1 Tax=Ogataea parapolymorpha (strain ATCC 26012 / BCRC 20466 / JCM 22074 / NRRL Y-7560 / DL-1) TaxID=871575 RepID=W1QH42_OGAPD|nr:Protein PNS1 [Ogataea parapolymorpha DL-1]ESX00915.1 Protein PNS1 [Ogataea parapolymorpha DL-1]KAG7865653.1 hypothetical protein KL918_004534 [Ogataea parapolymorpha]KAG7873474.1 hypothetical protein KL916_002078 [Ogataea parapolymorpha]
MSESSRLLPPPYFQSEEEPPEYEYTFEKPKEPVESDSFEESFKIASPKYHDKVFTLIFFATLVLFGIMASHSIKNIKNHEYILQIQAAANPSLWPLVVSAFVIPIVCSVVLLVLVWAYPLFFVLAGYFLLPLVMFGLATSLFATGKPGAAGIVLFVGFFQIWYLASIRRNLSFTSLVFRIIIETMADYPSTLVVSCLSSIVSGICSLGFFVLAAIIAYDRLKQDDANCPHEDGNDVCVSNTTLAVELFTLFTGCYIFEVLENLTHVTISGIYGSWYFFHRSAVKPRNPAWGSFKRAITYSFGSICFGSIIVPITRTIRQIITFGKEKVLNRQYGRDEEEENGLLFCALICLFSILEWLADQAEFWIKWFNKFAFSYLALYGKDYLSSSKDTYELLRFRGLLVLVTDCLVESTLTLYSILISLTSGGVFYLLYKTTSLFDRLPQEFVILAFIVQLLLGLFIAKVTLNSFNSGFITFLVALCINPEVFEQNYHDYYVKLTNYYPEISHTLKTPFPDYV